MTGPVVAEKEAAVVGAGVAHLAVAVYKAAAWASAEDEVVQVAGVAMATVVATD